MRSCFPSLVVAVAATVLLIAGGAHAQQWLSDRTRAEGRGIHLGDFELHPGIGSEIGYVSNVFLADTPRDSAILRVAPHLYLSTTEGGTKERPINFRAGASGTLRYYFAPSMPGIDMGVGQDARLVLKPSEIFRAEFFDDFHRSTDPFTEAAAPTNGTAAPKLPKFDRDQLGVGTRLQLSTPGQLLRAGLGYRFDEDFFEDTANFAGNRNNSHTISADTSWEFLPKTALLWNGAVRFHRFTPPSASAGTMPMTGTPTGPLRNSDTDVSSLIGLNGALTTRVGATVAVGYAAGFFAHGPDYDGVIAQVEVRWRLVDTVLWAVGYDRQFNPSFQGNYARIDRVKTRVQAMAFGALLVALKGEVTFIGFGADPALDGINMQGRRSDTHLLLNLNGEYRFVDWLAMTAEVGYLRNFSDYTFGMGDTAAYNQFSAFIGLRAFL